MASIDNNQPALPEVLVTGEFPFPFGAAGSNLMRGHCVALQTAGYTVGVLPKVYRHGKSENAIKLFRGVSYWEVTNPNPPSKYWNHVNSHLCLNDPRIGWLKQSGLKGVKAIIVYPSLTGTVSFLYQLKRLCKRYKLKLFYHVVEWHDWKHYGGIHASLCVVDAEFLRRIALRSVDGIIAITGYLQEYYTQKGVRSVCMPPLLDMSDPKWQNDGSLPSAANHRPIRLLFSGSYTRDRHDIILRSVLKMREAGADIIVEYLGATREQLQQEPGVGAELISALGAGIHFYGRVGDDELVMRIVRSVSFGIILRNNEHWSQTCFPSKVPEFNALGVPMLCNLSSDLDRYLEDGINSLVCKTVTVEDFTATLKRAWELTEPQFQAMRMEARKTAERFDARNYAEAYRQLIG